MISLNLYKLMLNKIMLHQVPCSSPYTDSPIPADHCLDFSWDDSGCHSWGREEEKNKLFSGHYYFSFEQVVVHLGQQPSTVPHGAIGTLPHKHKCCHTSTSGGRDGSGEADLQGWATKNGVCGKGKVGHTMPKHPSGPRIRGRGGKLWANSF